MAGQETYPKLQRQPLTLVLAEFKFNAVMNIAARIPSLQDQLRQTYPEVAIGVSHRYTVDPPSFGQEVDRSWTFFNRKDRKSVLIDISRVVVTTTNYERFPQFSKDCVEVLRVLEGLVSPQLLTRVGLRYNDAVVPESGEPLSAYVIPELLPAEQLCKISDGKVAQHQTETVVSTHVGHLRIRSMTGLHGRAVMPDLEDRFHIEVFSTVPTDRRATVLDFDHYWMGNKSPVEFSAKVAETTLAQLHETAREAFWSATTDFAREERWS